MSSLTYPISDVKPLPDVTSELDWQDLRERVDYASRWAFHEYNEEMESSGDREEAAKKATEKYVELMDGQEGRIPLWPYLK